MLGDLDEAERVVRAKLSDFVQRNTGDDKLFRFGSTVHVDVDRPEKKLVVRYNLELPAIVEQAEIKMGMSKPTNKLGIAKDLKVD